jgi:hypothetical protein
MVISNAATVGAGIGTGVIALVADGIWVGDGISECAGVVATHPARTSARKGGSARA